MANRLEKKCSRKMKKVLHLLNKEFYPDVFLFSDESKIVCIGNCGITTGVDEIVLYEIFESFGYTELTQVVVIPDKQYSFVTFADLFNCQSAVAKMSGKCYVKSNKIYMSSINKLPEIKDTRIYYDHPPGLTIVENFITDNEEVELLSLMNFQTDEVGTAKLKQRTVQHFGFKFNYAKNCIDKNPIDEKIPASINWLLQRLTNQKLMLEKPDQLTVNQYFTGQGIPPHVDTHSSFEGAILSLSLGGGTVLEFSLDGNQGKRLKLVYLPQRSLCIMDGPSRYEWSHGIRSRKSDLLYSEKSGLYELLHRKNRVSFTFRKVRLDNECRCTYTQQCDSQKLKIVKNDSDVEINPLVELERKHVLDVYEQIAPHFSDTRRKPWPKVHMFIDSLPFASRLLEVGCGSGKYLKPRNQLFQIGCDISSKLLSICRDLNEEVSRADCLNLPFVTGSFDAVICIAVIHHLASKERRIASIKELIRVLKPEGRALVYVWAMEQRRERPSTYLLQKRSNRKELTAQFSTNLPSNQTDSKTDYEKVQINKKVDDKNHEQISDSSSVENRMLKNLVIHENRSDFVQQDVLVPWKLKPQHCEKNEENSKEILSNIYYRYYHVFKERELEEIVTQCDAKVLQSYYDEGNWCILFEKK